MRQPWYINLSDLFNSIFTPPSKSYTLPARGNTPSATLVINTDKNEALADRNGVLKDIAKTTFRLNNKIKSEGVKAIFFLDRSSRLAESALKAVRDLKENNPSLTIDHLNPDFFKGNPENIDRMIRKAFLDIDTTNGQSMSKLLGKLEKMELIRNDLTRADEKKLSAGINSILINGSASELVNFMKENILIKLPSGEESQNSLTKKLQEHGLNPEDKIMIYDVCSHSGGSMNAVTKAFKAIGYNNLHPILMSPPWKENETRHFSSLTNHVSFQTCYPFNLAKQHEEECLKKRPTSIECEIKNPTQLQEEERRIYQQVQTYLAKHH